jgi:hypothetical protein
MVRFLHLIRCNNILTCLDSTCRGGRSGERYRTIKGSRNLRPISRLMDHSRHGNRNYLGEYSPIYRSNATKRPIRWCQHTNRHVVLLPLPGTQLTCRSCRTSRHDVSHIVQSPLRNLASFTKTPETLDPNRIFIRSKLDRGATFHGWSGVGLPSR